MIESVLRAPTSSSSNQLSLPVSEHSPLSFVLQTAAHICLRSGARWRYGTRRRHNSTLPRQRRRCRGGSQRVCASCISFFGIRTNISTVKYKFGLAGRLELVHCMQAPVSEGGEQETHPPLKAPTGFLTTAGPTVGATTSCLNT